MKCLQKRQSKSTCTFLGIKYDMLIIIMKLWKSLKKAEHVGLGRQSWLVRSSIIRSHFSDGATILWIHSSQTTCRSVFIHCDIYIQKRHEVPRFPLPTLLYAGYNKAKKEYQPNKYHCHLIFFFVIYSSLYKWATTSTWLV